MKHPEPHTMWWRIHSIVERRRVNISLQQVLTDYLCYGFQIFFVYGVATHTCEYNFAHDLNLRQRTFYVALGLLTSLIRTFLT